MKRYYVSYWDGILVVEITVSSAVVCMVVGATVVGFEVVSGVISDVSWLWTLGIVSSPKKKRITTIK